VGALLALGLPAVAQPTAFRKIGEMELRLLGVSATVDPLHPVVPKNIPSAVRIVVRAGQGELSPLDAVRFLGPNLEVRGDLSGPGLSETLSLPFLNPGDPPRADPFLLPLPGLTVSGNYTLANLRVESDGRPVLDVTPSSVTVEVIEQVLVTSVQTRALTLDEIRAKGIVLDSDDYLGFEFTLGLKLESQPVNLTFPVVFDRQGVAIPDPLTPPAAPSRQSAAVPMPTVVPVLLETEVGEGDTGGQRIPVTLPNGDPVRIPAVLVIPGNVGYLKQFFSAQLFVANGAPVGSGLRVRNVTGTIKLPPGADRELGTDDDPLALPETVRGIQPETLPVLGIGPDGAPGTEDDEARFAPGEQGQAEFLVRGEREGFHTLSFDIAAVLDGLVSGPVDIKGKASGGVLVRNPYFDMTFTVPSVVRRGERFKLYASVTNIGQGIANDVTVSLDAAALSGAELVSDQTVRIDTLKAGDSQTLAFELESQRTGQVVASYLKLEGPGQSGGTLHFSLGVGERGVPLSPDTLVLPAAVDAVPVEVLDAAMRVLGQAWSVANAPAGSLPRGVARTSKSVVVAKALALAEAGLRISLGQDATESVRALDYDFFAGTPRDAGFDQLLRDTDAGQALRQACGGAAPTEEPTAAGGPRLSAAAVIGPEVLAGAGPFGFHAILVFDRILDGPTAAVATHYVIPGNVVRSAKAVLSGRLVILNLAQPEGPYVPTTVDVTGLLDREGRRGGGSAELQSLLADPGAVVSGRVIGADGTPVNTATVVYTNNTDLVCRFPRQSGFASLPVDGDGRFEYRYVRRDNCGLPFEMVTQDPGTGAVRKSSGFVRAAGERIVLDIVLLGRGSVEGVVRDLQDRPVPDARVVAVSGADPQSGGQAQTDGNGTYRIDGITVGPVSVKAGKGASLGHAAGRIDRAGTTSRVDVVLDGGSVRVAGTVRKLESGVETLVPGVGVRYQIDPAPYPTIVGYVKTGADGRFQFDAMPPGMTQLVTYLDTGEVVSTTYFATAAGDDLVGKDLLVVVDTVETGTVQGYVFLPGGEPRVGAAQALVSVGSRGVLTDDTGFFSLGGVPARPNQSQSLSARSQDGKRTGKTAFLINQAGQVATVDVTLSGLGVATFTVLGPGGALAGQEVRLLSATCSDPCGCSPRTTDAMGKVTYEGLPLGTISVKAVRDMGTGYEAVTGSASVTRDGETAFGTLEFQGLGVVRGTVLDPEDRAAFGADVALVSRRFVNDGFFCGMVRGESHRARTGTDGTFRFTGVGLGTVSVSARQEFYPTPATGSGTLTAQGQELPFTLKLTDTTAGVLSGTVFLPDGVTPAGRGVQVTANGALPDVVVETDDQGKYRFAKIFPEGAYLLTLSDPVSGGRAQTRVYLRAGQDLAQDLRLEGRGTVRVTVVDAADTPVASAYVKLQESDFPKRSYEAAVEPPDQGTVPIEGVYEGPFSVQASDVLGRGGRVSGTMPGPGHVVEVKVRLTSTGTVTGHFIMPDRTTPIPFGVVKLTAGGKAIGQVTTQGSTDVGRFSFDYVPAGQVRLEAEDPLTGRTGVAVGEIETEGQLLEVDVFAHALGSVRGVVTSNEQTQAAANVTIVSGDYKATTLSDGQGEYLVRGVPAGRVVATASLAGGFLQGAASDNLEAEGATLTLDVPLRDSGRVTGRVLAAGEGNAAGPTSVVRLTVGGTGGATLTTLTQAEGYFSFDRVPAGQAQLVADVVSSIDSGQAQAVVPSGGSVDVPIRLRGVGSVSGQALDSGGNPTAGIVTFRVSGFSVSLVVGNEGTFELPEVPAGPFTATLRVTSGDFTLFGSASGDVVAGVDTPFTIQVQPSGTVTGVVLRSDGLTPAYGAEVDVHVTGGATVTVQAQANGAFTARGVPLGTLTVTASDPITAGLAVRRGLSLDTNGQVLALDPPLVLDSSPPTLRPVAPVPGSTRAAFAGPLVIDVADAEGLDPATLVMTQPLGIAATPFVIIDGRATSTLRAELLGVGENRLVARVKDLAGNEATTEWRFTVTGGTVRGTVVQADGTTPAAAVPVRLDGVSKGSADGSGAFVLTGVRPGSHTLQATDPATGLAGSLSFTLGDGEDRTLTEPLRLPAFGRIAGTVTHAGGGPAADVTVSVLFRSGSVVTDASGFFDLGALPLGTYTLDAAAPDGDRGQTTVTLTSLGVTVPGNITLIGVGVVTVTLQDATQALVGGARVTVKSASPLATLLTGYTGPAGEPAVFPSVLAGTITATATHPASGLEGVRTGSLAPGGELDLGVVLEPTGRIAGTVTRREGGIAAGVAVTLLQPRNETKTTDAQGAFAFEDVPLGSWSLRASDPVTDDIGEASGVLTTAGESDDGNVILNGVGTLNLIVTDATDASVADASVSVTSSGGRSYSTTTDAEGKATLLNVRAGTITATATHPTNGTRGTATDTLVAGGSLTLPLTLQATGAVHGFVLAPDQETAVEGAVVTLGTMLMTTGPEGEFTFAERPLGTYTLSAKVAGRLRARVTVAITTNGQTVEQNLVLVGAAAVGGRVTSGTSGVADAQVSLHSQTATFGGVFTATSDANGDYSIPDVPIGAFDISAVRGTDRATATGAVVADGLSVTVDLPLQASAVTVPINLNDGNDYQWQVARDGTLDHGNMFLGAENIPRLTVVRDGAAAVFTGPTCASTCTVASEEGKREIVLPQSGIAGLDVTRKVYVPASGYFARHLDIVTNPGTGPVTIDLSFTTRLAASSVIATSSSDAVYATDDRWITVDDSDPTDPYDTSSPFWEFWPLGVVNSGAGAEAPTAVSSTLATDGTRLLTETWSQLTLAPGQSLALLQFRTPQVDRARAEAASERLAQLPPEALVGLSAEEGALVRNFVVPPGLASPVAPLPANDGVVTGSVLAGDGQTLAGSRTVVFKSRSPYFGRPLSVSSNGATGLYQVTGTPNASSPNLVPRMAFDLRSSATVFGTRTASASGDFTLDAGGQPVPTSTVDVVYAGTGVLEVSVRRAGDGSAIASVGLTLSNGTSSVTGNTGTTGADTFVLLPPGDYTLRARLPNGPEQTVPLTVVAGQSVPVDVVFADLAVIKGTLRTAGATALHGTVNIDVPGGFSRSVVSNATNGTYELTDVPFGSYTVEAIDSYRSGALLAQTVTVDRPLVENVDFQFPPVGKVDVTVRVGAEDGPVLTSARVRWQSESRGPDYVFAGFTTTIGQLTIDHVNGPEFRVRAEHPQNANSIGESALTPIAEGETVSVLLVVPGVGTVGGTLLSRDDVAQAGHRIDALATTSDATSLANATANASGVFSIPNVPVGPLRLRSTCATTYSPFWFYGYADVDASIPSHGASETRNALCPFGSITSGQRREFWTFTAIAGDPIGLMQVPGHYGAPLADPYLEVYGPDGALLAASDDRTASDKASEVDFTAPADGTYVVAARAAAEQTGTYRLGDWTSATVPALREYEPPRATGVVKKDSDQSPVAGQAVRILGGATVREAVVTEAGGAFSLGVFPIGAFTLEATDGEGVVVARAMGSADTPGVNVPQDLVVPARGSVSVLVKRGSELQAGLDVTLTSTHGGALDEDRIRVRTTATAGTVSTTLPAGSVTARVIDPRNAVPYEVSGTLEDGSSLDLTLDLPAGLTHLFGTVTAADGATALPGAAVTLSGPSTFSTTTDATGGYDFASLPPGDYALTAAIGGASAIQNLALTGGERPLDIQIAVPVLKGRVTEADGTTAALASVELCDLSNVCVTQSTNAQGDYALFGGFPSWSDGQYLLVRVTAADDSGLTTWDYLYFSTGVATRDYRLPAAWAVYGTVRDGQGSPVAAQVRLSGVYPERTLQTAADGLYRFPHVAAFTSVAVAARDLQFGLPGRNSGVVQDGDLPLDVELAQAATFEGQLVDAADNALLGEIRFESLPHVAADGYSRWTATIPTDAAGLFSVVVPVGGFRAVHDPGSCAVAAPARRLLAVADGTLVEGANPGVTLRVGEGTSYPAVLAGTLGTYGPSPGHPSRDTCATAGDVTLTSAAGDPYPATAGRLSADGQRVASLLSQANGLDVRQEQFVPASGAFLRTITWLQNPTTADVTVSVDLTADFGDGVSWSLLHDTDDDQSLYPQDTWAFARLGPSGGPEAGAVWGTGATAVSFRRGDAYRSGVLASFSVGVPAGQRVGLMGFVVSRTGFGVLTHVKALADLTDVEALDGLSDAERQEIVNFAVPPIAEPATGVSGTVTRGGSPVPGALVAAVDPGGAIVALGLADANGQYALRGLAAGDVRVVALDPSDNRPGAASATLEAGAVTPADVALVPDGDMGTVHGIVSFVWEEAAENFPVEVTNAAYSPLWEAETTSAAAGAYSVSAPPGDISARVDMSNAFAESGALVPGGDLILNPYVPPGT
jgi:hypothetical protein